MSGRLKPFVGKVYALPNTLTAEVVFYNKAIFKKYGLAVPKTWNDLMAIVKTLKANGVLPFALGNNDPWPGTVPYMAIFDRLNGKDLYEKACLQNKSLWTDPAFTRALFEGAKAGMRFIGTWEVPGLYTKLGADLGFFSFPSIPGPEGKGRADG